MSRARCTALTAAGKPCRKFAVEGADRCAFHLGRAGRRTLLTVEVADQLVAMLRAGNYLAVACHAVGVSRQTFHDWMTRGARAAKGDAEFVELRERVERARAESEARNVTQIAQAARESWQAAAWLLERQYPERWGRVGVAARAEAVPTDAAIPADAAPDPFAEVDELARRRLERTS